MINIKKLKDNKAIAIAMAIALFLIILIPIYYLIFIPVYAGNSPIKISIEEGQSSTAIARILKEYGLIRSEFAFISYLKLAGEGGSLKAGKYNFSGRLDVPEIVSILSNGLAESDDIRLLISEGFNIWEIDERLTEKGLIREGEFSSKYFNEEGYLFPDTYRINQKYDSSTDKAGSLDFMLELRERMSDNFNKKTADMLAGLNSVESGEIITIASILEKEARTEKDMKLVSGIIRKRLQMGMLLQIDATVTFGACRRKFMENNFTKNCDVTFQGPAIEIKIDGPFNTYTRQGLPPAPISNPGLKAIEAALNPTLSDYLYYLSSRDGSQMIYSKTAGEHVANRRIYLGI